jgi:pimeloyl-ACP methyl ester carboxylesterase
MDTYVLVHGAWHGGWCWYKVVALLEKEGYRVEAPDMPSHGRDKTPISEITFESYVQSVCRIIDAQSEPVILVGHSWGGHIITQVAEYRPEKIKLLVYLTAFLVASGEQMLQVGKESILMSNVIVSEDQSYTTVRADAVKEVFYHDCSDEDVALAKLLLVPQARVSPALSNTTEQNFGRIPRVYIECLQDKAITPSRQKEMYTRLPCQKVISMNTSHSPFFSAPIELAKNLISLAD